MQFSCILTLSDIITASGIIISFIVSIVSIRISLKTLKQNAIMIEESTRPQIQIYPVFVDAILYLVIKNYGASEAHIDEVKCSHLFTKQETMGDDLGGDIFAKIKGAILSSGSSIKCPLIGHEVSNEVFDFQIDYHSEIKSYTGHFSFNPISCIPFADMSPTSRTTDGHLQNIAKELHNIVKSNI